jgi:hypothetical protein
VRACGNSELGLGLLRPQGCRADARRRR